MASKSCKNNADSFCYVCGVFLKVRDKKFPVAIISEAYEAYFKIPIQNLDKTWAPHFSCKTCKNNLEACHRDGNKSMHFTVPRLWKEPTDHNKDCYFCMVDTCKRQAGRNTPNFIYPDIPSASAPVPNSDVDPNNAAMSTMTRTSSTKGLDENTKVKPLTATELKELLDDMELIGDKRLFLFALFKQRGLVQPNVTASDIE